MIKEKAGEFILVFADEEKTVLTGYEGGEAVLDLTSFKQIKRISRKAFLSCKILRKVTLPGSIEKIEEWAFSKCSNLQSVIVNGDFNNNIFSKGTFGGCDSLSEVAFANLDDGFAHLLAITANKMPNDYLLMSDDLGQKTWYDKWDICLTTTLNADSSTMEADFATGGEEDLPFVGVGMVDGEMPDEGVDFFRGIEKNKCLLCYMRLRYNTYLSGNMNDFIRDFIKERAFGKSPAYAFSTLNEECNGDVEFYKIYMDVVKPDKETINKMAQSLNSTLIQAKAYLIEQAAGEEDSSFFDDMML